MVKSKMQGAALFGVVWAKRSVLLQYGNILIKVFNGIQNTNPTENSLNDILNELVINEIRANEKRTYDLWTKMYAIGIEYELFVPLTKQDIDELTEQRRIKDERDYL